MGGGAAHQDHGREADGARRGDGLQQQPLATSSGRRQRITVARSAPTGDMFGLKRGRSCDDAAPPGTWPTHFCIGPAHAPMGGSAVTAANTAAKPLDNACPVRTTLECRPSTRTATDGIRSRMQLVLTSRLRSSRPASGRLQGHSLWSRRWRDR
jgi:hypothetical protein